MIEWIKYSPYGIPFGLPLGDTDSNGLLNVLDYIAILSHSGDYDVRYDLNLDGAIDGTDATLASAASPITLGWGNLSDVGNRRGYAGYEHAPYVAAIDRRPAEYGAQGVGATYTACYGCCCVLMFHPPLCDFITGKYNVVIHNPS